jgi:leucine dehydrogenase
MSVFAASDFSTHEQVVFAHDAATGLRAIIAIHNTQLGPALGGCRMWSYADEQAAITDVLRLSKGMTYKAALAGLALGGGKSVIIGNSKQDKTPALMRAMGQAVERLGGRYIVAEDVGTNTQDMTEIRKQTSHVAGLAAELGGSGDPSPATAYGVYLGLVETVTQHLHAADLAGLKVAVQGLGNVGWHLCEMLHEAGAKLIVTDINKDVVAKAQSQFGAELVGVDDIYGVQADIFAPCALGAILNDQTIVQLKAKVVAGSANNQLKEARHGLMLQDRGILYAPDYAINAGGVINVGHEKLSAGGYDRSTAYAQIEQIPLTLRSIYEISAQKGITPAEAADQLAELRLRPVAVTTDQGHSNLAAAL